MDNPSLRNCAPRFGFAWDVFGTGKTALRGGFGMFYLQFDQTWVRQGGFRAPPWLAELDRSGADLRAAEARRDDQRFQVTLETKQLFFAALRQGELLEVAGSRLRQAEESLEMTRRQARVGLATTSDTLRARLEMVNARQAVLTAETATRAARFALARQIGEEQPVTPTPPAISPKRTLEGG